MNWHDVLKRDDIVGGDVEIYEDDNLFRGPIKSITLKDGMVTIELEWCATVPIPGRPGFWVWRAIHVVVALLVSSTIEPRDLGDNRVMISAPALGTWIIYPKGGSKLDPANVAGLKVPHPAKKPKP